MWAKALKRIDKLHYLDARVYGTDEQDVGKYDEDADVDSQHNWGAAGKKYRNSVRQKCLVHVNWNQSKI